LIHDHNALTACRS